MFHLKLNVFEIIYLKAQYIHNSPRTGIDGDIHELLQDKLAKHENSNRKQDNYIFKIDYEKLVNIYYFLKGRAVWVELPEELVSVMNKCDKRMKNYEKKLRKNCN
tara:strand:- start:1309 stop:1623 length:315 start_codon:yes stop_codon:yes gene_type:complete